MVIRSNTRSRCQTWRSVAARLLASCVRMRSKSSPKQVIVLIFLVGLSSCPAYLLDGCQCGRAAPCRHTISVMSQQLLASLSPRLIPINLSTILHLSTSPSTTATPILFSARLRGSLLLRTSSKCLGLEGRNRLVWGCIPRLCGNVWRDNEEEYESVIKCWAVELRGMLADRDEPTAM